MKLNPYLNFPGNCAAAFQFYEQYLGGKITMTITFADSPLADEVPPEWRGKILHTRMMVGDVALMGGDELPEDYIAPRGFNVTLNVEQAAGAERIFRGVVGKRNCDGAAAGDVLGRALWDADGSVRHPVDDKLRARRMSSKASATCDGEIPFKASGMKKRDKI